jgi:hypothetical protein
VIQTSHVVTSHDALFTLKVELPTSYFFAECSAGPRDMAVMACPYARAWPRRHLAHACACLEQNVRHARSADSLSSSS